MAKKHIVAAMNVTATFKLNSDQMGSLREAINIALVGQPNINEMKKGVMLPIKFSKEKIKAIEEAHYNLRAHGAVNLTFDVTDTGELINFRVKQRDKRP